MKRTLRDLHIVITILICAFPLFLYSSGGNEPPVDIILTEIRLHPAATVQDIYKLLHQSSMGPGHWKMDLDMARSYLRSEILEMKEAAHQPLCQFISSDSELVRIYLSPYMKLKGDIDSLAMAFVKTSEEFRQSKETLESSLSIIVRAAEKRTLSFHSDSVRSYFQQMKKNGYPAVHHSTVYSDRYHPAYRVVFRKFLPVSLYHATH